MSILKITKNLFDGSWKADEYISSPYTLEVRLDFNGEFKKLMFGVEIFVNNELVRKSNYPPSGVEYKDTNQDYIEVFTVETTADTPILVKVWSVNGGVFDEYQHTVVTPTPEKPFNDFIWDGNYWVPPIPYPSDGKSYQWSDNISNWIES
jgi:hypothetical protein